MLRVITPSPLPQADGLGIDAQPIHLPKSRRLTLLALTCLIFFITCGGPFGLEGLIGTVGPGWAIVLIIVTPLIWSLPMALMVAELSTMMPEEGGYYIWVRETLGPFWGVQEAWWTISYSTILLASFSVLFVSYLAFFIPGLATGADAAHPGLAALLKWLVAVSVMATVAAVNLRGARDVGRSAKIGALFVLGAFALLVLVWLKQGPAPGTVVGIVTRDLASKHSGTLLLGLSIIAFNYSGWDNASTFAGEVDQPQRNYPRALAGALVVIVLCYLLPVFAGVSLTSSPDVWNADAGWPVIAQMIGGRWLGALIAAAGLVSMWGLCNAQVLYLSRLPYVMARDGWLPKALAQSSSETAVPKTAILWCCAIGALFAALSFGSLAVITCLLNTAGLTLEFLALIVLRVKRPDAPRGFRVPGGWLGLGYVCVSPFVAAMVLLMAIFRDWRSYPGQILVVVGVVVAGVVQYFARRSGARALQHKYLRTQSDAGQMR
jgi:amino acid transporter